MKLKTGLDLRAKTVLVLSFICFSYGVFLYAQQKMKGGFQKTKALVIRMTPKGAVSDDYGIFNVEYCYEISRARHCSDRAFLDGRWLKVGVTNRSHIKPFSVGDSIDVFVQSTDRGYAVIRKTHRIPGLWFIVFGLVPFLLFFVGAALGVSLSKK